MKFSYIFTGYSLITSNFSSAIVLYQFLWNKIIQSILSHHSLKIIFTVVTLEKSISSLVMLYNSLAKLSILLIFALVF